MLPTAPNSLIQIIIRVGTLTVRLLSPPVRRMEVHLVRLQPPLAQRSPSPLPPPTPKAIPITWPSVKPIPSPPSIQPPPPAEAATGPFLLPPPQEHRQQLPTPVL